MKAILDIIVRFFREKDIPAKVVCLILSVILWAYLSTTSMGELRFRVPLDYTRLPAGLIVSQMPVRNVIVIVEGDKEHLRNVTINNLQAYVDFGANPRVGSSDRYRIRVIKTDLPEGIKTSLEPKRITLTVEKRSEKKLKVIPTITGDVKEGNIVGRIHVSPDYILVAGPAARMEGLDYVYTEEMSVDDQSSDIEREVPLKKDRLEGLELMDGVSVVKVTVPIMQYGNLYSVEAPIVIRNMNPAFRYSTDRNSARIYLRSQGKNRVSPDDIILSVDAGLINPETFFKKGDLTELEREMQVGAQLKPGRDGADVVSVVPEKIIITIQRK